MHYLEQLAYKYKTTIDFREDTMLAKLKIKLKSAENKKYSYNISSLTQGYIMENISTRYASFLHNLRLNPYSQYIIKDGESLIWNINTLDIQAKKEIIDKILYIINNEGEREIFLKKPEDKLCIEEVSVEESNYKELRKTLYESENSRLLKIKFLTPAAFKQDNRYCIFPSVRLIFQSLMNKYDAAAGYSSIYDAEVLQEYERHSYIAGYKLRSTAFSLEGVSIPSFIGEIAIKINGTSQMVNLAYMLAKFGSYSGVGIKTSMGMGAVSII